MELLFEGSNVKLAYTLIVLIVFLLIRFITKALVRKIGRRNGVNEARIRLIGRYSTVTLLIIYVLVEAYIQVPSLKT